jgi:hypothetical protein
MSMTFTSLELAILECLRKPSGASEKMMTTLELLADKRLSSFWFLRARLYGALRELIDGGEIAIVQRDILVPERGLVPRNYYAIAK